MTSLEELVLTVATLSSQQQALIGEVQRLQAENQLLRAANPEGLGQVVNQLGQAVQAMTAAASAASSGSRRSLIDVKGLGKPSLFNNNTAKFTEWLRKTIGFCL